MADEPIGSVFVNVTGDYSQLQTQLNDAQNVAQQAGSAIADAFTGAASGASTFDDQIAQMVSSGSTLGEALSTLGIQANGAGDRLVQTGVAAGEAAGKTDELGGSLKRVGNDAEAFGQSIGGAIANPLQTAGNLARDFITELGSMGLAALGVAAAIVALGKEIIELVLSEGQAARETENFAMKMNLTFQEGKHLSEMAQVASVDLGTLRMTAMRLADAMEDPEGAGKKVATALHGMGIAATDSGDLLLKLLEHLAQIPDVTERISQAHIVMGRSSVQLEPLIANYDHLSAAVTALGGQLDGEMVQKLLAANEQGKLLGIAWDHLKQQLAAAFSPAVTAGLEMLSKLLSGGGESPLEAQIAKLKAEIIDLGIQAQHGTIAVAGMMGGGFVSGQANAGVLQQKKDQLDLLELKQKTIQWNADYNNDVARSNAAAAAASAAAKAAALEQNNAMVEFNNSVVTLYNTIPDTYDKYVLNLSDGGKTAKSMLSSVEADIQRAGTVMEGMRGAPLAAMREWVTDLTSARDKLKGFAADDAWNELAVKVSNLGAKFGPQMDKILAAGGPVAERIADLMNAAPNAPDAMQGKGEFSFIEEVLKVQKQIDDASQKTGSHFQEMWEKYRGGAAKAQEATIPITALIHDRLPEAFIRSYDESVHLNESFKILGISGVSAAGESQAKWIGAFEDIVANSKSLTEVEAAWGAIGNKVNTLARTNLPEAIKLQDEYIDALIRTNAPIMQIYDAQQKELQLEIAMKEQRGESANAEIIALENMRIKTGALIESTQLLGNLYVDIVKDFQNAYDALGKGIADVIVDGKNFWDSWHKILNDLEKQILEQIVKTALHGIADALIVNTGLAGKLAGVLGGIFGGGAGGGLVGTGPIGGGVTGGLESALGGGASVAGGVGSAVAGAAVSTTLGTVLSIAQLGVSVASGIVSGYQQAHMESDLQKIEESTRYLKIGLVTAGDSMVSDTHIIRNTLTDFMHFNWGVVATYYQGFAEKLDVLIGMGGIHSSGVQAQTVAFSSAPSVAAMVADGPSINVDLSGSHFNGGMTDGQVVGILNRGVRMSKLTGAFPPGRFPQ